MTFFYARFVFAWACWLIFADKTRWKEIFPVCIFASFLSFITDEIVHFYIPYWEYYGDEPTIIRNLMDHSGVYVVVTYLFIQWLPQKQTLIHMFSYWFIWTALAIVIEYIHLITGHMAHYHGWSLWHSYVSDWILYWIFYQYHKIFQSKNFI